MQLFAANEKNEPIFAMSALKQKDYYCLECQKTVRLRSGPHRHAHFFHVSPVVSCSQHQKGYEHILTQLLLLQLLPENDAKMEVRFDEIHRIADLVWISEKIVIEVQCSSITAAEITARNSDYAKLGWQTIWLLNDRRYNQKRVSSAEYILRSSPHYFIHIDEDNQLLIYDQFDVVDQGLRKNKMEPLPVRLNAIQKIEALPYPPRPALSLIHQRLKSWPLYVENDLMDHFLKENSEYIQRATNIESERTESTYSWIRRMTQLIIRPYKLALQMLLEKFCR